MVPTQVFSWHRHSWFQLCSGDALPGSIQESCHHSYPKRAHSDRPCLNPVFNSFHNLTAQGTAESSVFAMSPGLVDRSIGWFRLIKSTSNGIWWSKGTETLRRNFTFPFFGMGYCYLTLCLKNWTDTGVILSDLMDSTSARRWGSSERAGGGREDPWAVHRHENVGFWWTVDGLIQMLRAHESNSTTEPCQTHETWKVDKLFLVSTILLSALWSAAAGYLSWCEKTSAVKKNLERPHRQTYNGTWRIGLESPWKVWFYWYFHRWSILADTFLAFSFILCAPTACCHASVRKCW